MLIVNGTLVPTRDHTITERSKNYRYSTNRQVVIDADTGLVVVVGRPLAGNRNDCKAWEESGAKAAVGNTLTMADGGYPGTGVLIPHRRERGQGELPDWKYGTALRACPGDQAGLSPRESAPTRRCGASSAGSDGDRLAVADMLVLAPEAYALVEVVGSVRIRGAGVQPGSLCTVLAKASQPVQ
ncbi:Transposase DDE domain protein [Streptomyces sp. NP10]|nr:Transposase DDE domain protein [Streptomyces sp. NP10]